MTREWYWHKCNSWTSLHEAALLGNTNIAKADGKMPLYLAKEKGYEEVI